MRYKLIGAGRNLRIKKYINIYTKLNERIGCRSINKKRLISHAEILLNEAFISLPDNLSAIVYTKGSAGHFIGPPTCTMNMIIAEAYI